MDKKKLKVSVDMITYGHGNYIRQAIESVLMQNTNFEFDLIIADDCSPDNTREVVEDIINNHPEGYKIKYFRHEKNIGMQANGLFAADKCTGKYMAICEGDDYWTDPFKLQKQVDFLEENLDYGIVYTDSLAYYQVADRFVKLEKPKNRQNSFFKDLIYGTADIYTLTVCFRKDLFQDYKEEIKPHLKKWLLGDLPLWLFISNRVCVGYINDVTTVYRVLDESASNTQNLHKHLKFKNSVFQIKLFFLNEYSKNDSKTKKEITSIYLYEQLVWNILFKGNFKQFIVFLYQFHLGNNNFKLFIGSFYQLLKKIKSEFIRYNQ